MSQLQPLTVQVLPIEVITLDPGNPRHHSQRQIKQIARSIQSFGFNVPILLDRNNKVLAGHGRVLAARNLGWRELPTVRLDHLNEAQSRAFMIADNRLTENSAWDDRLLGDMLSVLAQAELTFNIEATGFSMGEIDLRIEEASGGAKDNNNDTADSLPDSDAATPVSKPGDQWLLGSHRVICGDALEARTYSLLLQQQERAAMAFTDPPYNVKIDGHVSGLGKIHHREFAMATGELTKTEFIGFLTIVTRHMVRYSVDGSIHYICMDWRHAGEMMAAGDASFSELKNICVWAKHNAGMGSFYRSQHEFVFVYKAGRGSHRNNIELGQHGRNRSNIWNYPGTNSFGRATDAILDRQLFEAVQRRLDEQRTNHTVTRSNSESLLMGRIFDDRGNRMTPSTAHKYGKRYRYYLSSALTQGQAQRAGSIRRIPAPEIETLVVDAVRKRLREPMPGTDQNLINENVGRVEIHAAQIAIKLTSKGDRTTKRRADNAVFYVPWKKITQKRRREIIAPATSGQDIRPIRSETRLALVAAIAQGRRWLEEIVMGNVAGVDEIAVREECSVRQVNITISLAFLSPTLVAAAIDGRLPRGVGVARLRDAPAEWSKQHAMLGLA